MDQETTPKLVSATLDPLGDIMVGYHYVSALLALYSNMIRDGATLAQSQRKQFEKHSEEILDDIGTLYEVWDVQRKLPSAASINLVESKKNTLKLHKFSRHDLLDRLIHGLNAWTSARHWLAITMMFDRRWTRILTILKNTYPEQLAKLESLESRAFRRASAVEGYLTAMLAEARKINGSYAVPTEMTAD